MASKDDLAWRSARISIVAAVAYDDSRYTLHRVANVILAVGQLAAIICHSICFGMMISKIDEIENKIGRPLDPVSGNPDVGSSVCILYMGTTKYHGGDVVEYNGGQTCDFVIFASMSLAILAAMTMIFLIVRIVLVKR